MFIKYKTVIVPNIIIKIIIRFFFTKLFKILIIILKNLSLMDYEYRYKVTEVVYKL